jgi:hypothetical protein
MATMRERQILVLIIMPFLINLPHKAPGAPPPHTHPPCLEFVIMIIIIIIIITTTIIMAQSIFAFLLLFFLPPPCKDLNPSRPRNSGAR